MDYYSTRPMDDEEPACKLANAMMASGGFDSVTVLSREDGHVVMFAPCQPVPDGERVARMCDQRCNRAESEGSEYVFVETGMHDQMALCYSSSGASYEVSRTRCTCPDYQFRCLPRGIACKHQIALGIRRAAAAS